MDQFEEYQNLWQSQELDTIKLSEIVEKLNKIESKNRVEILIVNISFPLTLVILYFLMPPGQIFYQIGFFILAVAMAGMFILFHRNRYGKSVELMGDNITFIENQISKLKMRVRIASVYMRIYTAALIIAVNVAYIASFAGAGRADRIWIHVGVSAAIFVFQEILIRRKLRKYQNEFPPLIDHLEGLKSMV